MDLLTLIRAFAVDEAGRLEETSYDLAVGLALARYSTDRPYVASGEVCVQEDGLTLPLPDDWVWEFSRVLAVEFASGQALPQDAWKQRQYLNAPAGQGKWGCWLELTEKQAPASKMVIIYRAYHTPETLPMADLEAVAHYGAAILLDQLAVIYSADKQSTIQSDSVEHQAKGGSYAARANEQRSLYLDHMGIDPKRTVAAGALVSIGQNRLLHNAPKPRRRAW